MTDPSRMTSGELQRAIAERLGWTELGINTEELGLFGTAPGKVLPEFCPNYPGDPVAALGLLDEYDDVDIWKDSTGWNCAFGKVFCHDKPFARAISEAWLKAKRGE